MGFDCIWGTPEFRIRKAFGKGTRASLKMSLVLANIDEFAKISAKPLDREQF